MATKITKNFTIEEVQHDKLAIRHGIRNNVPIGSYNVMNTLFRDIMQPLRDSIGQIDIISGYRSKILNGLWNGTDMSQHMYSRMRGAACDFKHNDLSPVNMINTILKLKLPFDKLVIEYPETYTGGWLHASVCGDRNNDYVIYTRGYNQPYRKVNYQDNDLGIFLEE